MRFSIAAPRPSKVINDLVKLRIRFVDLTTLLRAFGRSGSNPTFALARILAFARIGGRGAVALTFARIAADTFDVRGLARTVFRENRLAGEHQTYCCS